MRDKDDAAEPYASREELDDFLDELGRLQARFGSDEARLQAETAAVLAKHGAAALRRLANRAYVDMPKSYSQKTGSLPARRTGTPLADDNVARRNEAAPSREHTQPMPPGD